MSNPFRNALCLTLPRAAELKSARSTSVALAAALVGLGLLLAAPAQATNYGATDAASLIAAINTANGNSSDDTIDLGGHTITLTAANNAGNGLPHILTTSSAGKLAIENGTITRDGAAPQFRIFYVDSGADLTLSNVTLENGHAPDGAIATNGADGGAIYNNGTLTLTASTLTTNATGTGGDGGAVGNGGNGGDGGAIYSSGTLTMTGSALSGNHTGKGGGGGIGGGAGNGGNGGAIYNLGTLTVTESTLSSNGSGNGGDGGGAATIDGGSGGNGGAIYNQGGTLTLTRTTLSNNSAGNGGATAPPVGNGG
ncbi:MAG TPA: hypothetical protein VKA53_08955, partial [Thermoanaerobaculia bacterium]|nr:hypothetical protein [Thermoanaerobaculia bacterium]